MENYNIRLQFTEMLLGTAPANKEIYKKYILENAPVVEVEEVETLPVEEGKALTVFHRWEDQPALMNYQIKGFFKDSCNSLRRCDGTLSKPIKAYKKIIDGCLFVAPRYIPIECAGSVDTLERPIRADTPKGPRVALTKSECVPAGSTIEFTLKVIGAVSEDLLIEWFDYGCLKGLGQWRNGGYGTFTYTMEKL